MHLEIYRLCSLASFSCLKIAHTANIRNLLLCEEHRLKHWNIIRSQTHSQAGLPEGQLKFNARVLGSLLFKWHQLHPLDSQGCTQVQYWGLKMTASNKECPICSEKRKLKSLCCNQIMFLITGSLPFARFFSPTQFMASKFWLKTYCLHILFRRNYFLPSKGEAEARVNRVKPKEIRKGIEWADNKQVGCCLG